MGPLVWVVIAIVIVAVVALVAVGARKRRTAMLRDRFGPESDEQRVGRCPVGQRAHRRVVRRLGEPAGCVEHFREQVHVPRAAEERPGRPSAHHTAKSMSSCCSSGSYQVARACGRPAQGRSAIDLIVCTATRRSRQVSYKALKLSA